MEVLTYLAEHHGEVIAKEELIHSLWTDVFVTDDALTRCIGELRRAVEDDAREPSFIQNIPKRGYLLLPEVVWDGLHGGAAPDAGSPQSAQQLEVSEQRVLFRPRFWFIAAFIAALLSAIGLTTYHVTTRSRSGDFPPTKHRLAVIPLTNVSADPLQEYFADGMTEQLEHFTSYYAPSHLCCKLRVAIVRKQEWRKHTRTICGGSSFRPMTEGKEA